MEEIQQKVETMSLSAAASSEKKKVEEKQQQQDSEEIESKTMTHGGDEVVDEKEMSNNNNDGDDENDNNGQRQQEENITGESSGRKIFIGGTAYMTSEQHLRDYFETFGEVEEVVIPCDRYTGRPRGFGFVTFKDAAVTEKVLDNSLQHKIRDKVVEIKRAVPRGSAAHPSFRRGNRHNNYAPRTNQMLNGGGMVGGMHNVPLSDNNGGAKSNINDYLNNTNKIFVGGLHTSVNGEEFQAHFEKFGKVADAVIMYDRATGRSRGFGFVTFEKDEGMKAAIDHRPHVLRGKQVEVKMAEPRGKSMSNKKGGVGRGGYNRGRGGRRGGVGGYPSNSAMIPPVPMSGTNGSFAPHQFAPIPPYGVQAGMYGAYPSFAPTGTNGSNAYSAQSHYAPSSPSSSMNAYGFNTAMSPGMMGMLPSTTGTWPTATDPTMGTTTDTSVAKSTDE